MVKVKICGLSRPCDIQWANLLKPDYIGFVFAQSRRQVSPGQAVELRKMLEPGIISTGVFVNTEIAEILSLIDRNTITIVQLHGQEDEEYIQRLKSLSSAPVIKAVSVTSPQDVQQWQHSAADYLLLDHQGGGTGQRFDWKMIGETEKPYFLAGGLHPDNVSEALRQTKPFAIDTSSGVETDGYKDFKKMQAMIRRIRKAYE